ncbi:MAG: GGDEF domain-containing protein [Oscillospiraceae bacterium]|nr:GGDEF domain-containing protein [Oscillospiraceae bacterium]
MINIDEIPFDATTTEYYNIGDIIIKDGDLGGEMYILTAGKADVYKNYGELGEVKVASLSAGDFFGETSLFLNRERTATVVAASYLSVFAINHSNALDFFKSHSEATFSLIKTLCARLVNINDDIGYYSIKDAEDDNVDDLTGIYNRRYFAEAAGRLITESFRRGKRAFIALADLDYLKKINDTYGHQMGDEALKGVAQTIKRTINSDGLLARYGGGMFVMLFPSTDREAVHDLTEHVRQNISEEPIKYEGRAISAAISMGIAEANSEEETEEAVASAEKALYKAKGTGRNRCVFYDDII